MSSPSRAPQHALGLDFVDRDHAALELMFEAASQAEGEDLKRLAAAVVEETEAHFAREEEFMRGADFPGLHCHAAQHRMLLMELRRRTSSDDEERRRFGVTIPQLVLSHVLTMDRMMAEFARGELSAADFDGLRLPVPETAS
jgi:hemerythrin-like metal-binding protein